MNIDFANENIVVESIKTQLTPVKIKKNIDIKEKCYKALKRMADIGGAIIGSIFVFPLMIGIGIANFLVNDKGPIFYTQNRIGKNGKEFKMYKFRSMVVGADEILEEYLENNAEAREEYRINKKLKNDPRITRVGNFIRKTSLDEFPQFINVLKGEMSLVGPRPYLPKETEDMGKYLDYITPVKPGITGFWQISGRNELTFQERLELDKEYFKRKSITMDLKILFKTVLKVFNKEGAL